MCPFHEWELIHMDGGSFFNACWKEVKYEHRCKVFKPETIKGVQNWIIVCQSVGGGFLPFNYAPFVENLTCKIQILPSCGNEGYIHQLWLSIVSTSIEFAYTLNIDSFF